VAVTKVETTEPKMQYPEPPVQVEQPKPKEEEPKQEPKPKPVEPAPKEEPKPKQELPKPKPVEPTPKEEPKPKQEQPKPKAEEPKPKQEEIKVTPASPKPEEPKAKTTAAPLAKAKEMPAGVTQKTERQDSFSRRCVSTPYISKEKLDAALQAEAQAAAQPGGAQPTKSCQSCGKKVYPMEELKADERIFHKICFRCKKCNSVLKLGSFAAMEGEYFCKVCFKKNFFSKGNYSDGFGKLTPQQEHDSKTGRDPTQAFTTISFAGVAAAKRS